MTINERVKVFAKSKGLKIKQFEEACGLSNGYVASMRKGMGLQKLQSVLAAFPDLNRDWLLYEEGDMLKAPGQQITVEGTNSHNQQVKVSNTYNESSSNDKKHDDDADLRKLLAETMVKQSEQIDQLLEVIKTLAAK